MSIRTKGLDITLKTLSIFIDINKKFDETVFRTSVEIFNNIKAATPYNEKSPFAHTRNKWITPKKLADSKYTIDNTKTTTDQFKVLEGHMESIPLALILNDGRQAVEPLRAKKLFIPLTRRAIQWYARWVNRGAKMPKSYEYGVDYVYAKRAKAVPPTYFIDKEETRGATMLEKAIIRKILRGFK